ncbi:MAG: alpha-glucosidase [Anaerolineaceae bacterium]
MDKNFLWWRDGVIYQIYPRSYADSNNDGIGDLPGIISKLDYLSDLGVDALWLSPIYPSPDKDFGYDVADYFAIDPKYGTMADFDLLLSEAHKRNIHIVLDLVLNHTSDQSAWFQASKSSRDNAYRDWYIWRDPSGNEKTPPNNWKSVFGGPGWQYDENSGQYYFHMFVKEQPDLNWRNPETYQKMLDVFRFWLDRGVDGFRLDVFNEYFKDDQFRNNPPKFGIRPFDRQAHIYDVNRPEMMGVLKDIRTILDGYPERYAVGETFMATTEEAANYIGPEKLHAGFDFNFLQCPWNPKRFLDVITKWDSLLSTDAWPNYVLNNHDQPRSATRYGQGENDERLKVAAAMLLTLRGTPFLYYGEEIGMRDIRLKRSELQDPVGVRYWPIPVGRDGCRSPMQWDESENAGFGTRKPWLKVHPNYRMRNVKAQTEDETSLFHFYKRLLAIRKSTPALQRGSFIPLTYDPRRLLAYLRQDAEQTVLIVLNFGKRKVRLATGMQLRSKGWQLVLSNKRTSVPAIVNGWLPLLGNEASIYLRKTDPMD